MTLSPIIAAFAGLLTQQTVIVGVPDPVLPQGELVALGSAGDRRVFIDAASFDRSDLRGVFNVDAVIVPADAAAGFTVARLWIMCDERLFQISSGRRYDLSGQQIGLTGFEPDRPLEPGSAPDLAAKTYCHGEADFTGLERVSGWREAIDPSGTD